VAATGPATTCHNATAVAASYNGRSAAARTDSHWCGGRVYSTGSKAAATTTHGRATAGPEATATADGWSTAASEAAAATDSCTATATAASPDAAATAHAGLAAAILRLNGAGHRYHKRDRRYCAQNLKIDHFSLHLRDMGPNPFNRRSFPIRPLDCTQAEPVRSELYAE
jgi:hypothetical protein